ncbi:MAG TPA: alpha/beta fold hydrolase [Symbiobacteriaceae bacterium]|jgi:medium-chain acyl-[acyl-carrier-protein] hydrolase|nr:alpha/beta fold hydrolase [Symbiobacteriaceae bacterium]
MTALSPISPSFQKWHVGPEPPVRLFCFPYAGGGAAVFSHWPEVLGRHAAVYALQLPGHWSRMAEQPVRRLFPLVRGIAEEMLAYVASPFALFGHSMGALVAFELARLLRRKYGLCPTHLFVSGFRPPHLPDPHPALYRLPDCELLDRLKTLGGTPNELLADSELLSMLLPVIRADLEVCGTYAYTDDVPLPCPITALGGVDDPLVQSEQMDQWQRHTSSFFRLHLFPGDHFYLLSARQRLLTTVSNALKGCHA